MKKLVAAAVAAALLYQPAASAMAATACYSPAAIEAEEAIRFMTDLMVASTACRDQTYGLFQQRNRDAIVAYQHALIKHFHGNAAFDHWNTALANEYSMKQAGKSSTQVCEQAAEIMKKAAAFDLKSFRAFAAAAAANAGPRYTKCGR
jgi:hypothetical protein